MRLKFKFKAKRRIAHVSLLIFVITFSACAQEAQPQTFQESKQQKDRQAAVAANSDKQRAAEAAVDRLQQRFYATLDFSVIWKEMYVSDKALRWLEVEAITFKYLNHSEKTNVSREARERAYIALGNYWHLMSALRFTAKEDDMKTAFSQIEKPYELFSRRGKPFSTSGEFDKDLTGNMNEIGDILRKYVVQSEFNSAAYQEKLGRVAETEAANPERIREVFTPAGLKPDNQIYVVSREIFHYYLIEEQGQFKLLTFLLRRRH